MNSVSSPAAPLARESDRARPLRLEEICIVDADVHIDDSPAQLAPFCDQPWRVALEHIATMPARYLDVPGFCPAYRDIPPFPGGTPARSVRTPRELREQLDALHIDIPILFPDHLLTLAALPNADYAAALTRAYNRWLGEVWLASGDPGFYGALVACPQDPQTTVREIERYGKEERVVAVYLPAAGVEPLWGHRKYDPIFAAAEEYGLPVMLHAVTLVSNAFPFQLHQFDSTFARHSIAHTFAMMANMVSIISTGVPARFPRLKICFTEGGVSWVPFLMMRLDKEYNERRREVPWLSERPSAYIRRMYFATQPFEEPERGEDLVALMRVYGGEQNTIFASDWPHHDFDHPSLVLNLPLSDEAKRRIMGETALELFGIPLPARYQATENGRRR